MPSFIKSLNFNLTESKRKDAEYFSMFAGFLKRWPRSVSEERIKEEIENFKELLKRHDRVIVALKGFRWTVAYGVRSIALDLQPDDENDLREIMNEATKFRLQDEELKHYADMFHKSASMDRFDWSGKTADQIRAGLADLERQWMEKRSGTIEINDVDKPIIKFPNGFEWVKLDRGGCRIEGDAMGHCGNGSGSDATHIFSLRQRVKIEGQYAWKPCLTFISNNGYLGETKGRANTKPSPKYHPYIVDLLKSDYVLGINGGGYKPQNNFHLEDLPLEVQRELAEAKPRLLGPEAVSIEDKDIVSEYGEYVSTSNIELFKRHRAIPSLAKRVKLYQSKSVRHEGTFVISNVDTEDSDAFMALAQNPKISGISGLYLYVSPQQAKELLNKPSLWAGDANVYHSIIHLGLVHEDRVEKMDEGVYRGSIRDNEAWFAATEDYGNGFLQAKTVVLANEEKIIHKVASYFGESDVTASDEQMAPLLKILGEREYTPASNFGVFMNKFSLELQSSLAAYPSLWSIGDRDYRPIKKEGWVYDPRGANATYYKVGKHGLGEGVAVAWQVGATNPKVEFTIHDADDHRNHFAKYAAYLKAYHKKLEPVLTHSDPKTHDALYAYLDDHGIEYTKRGLRLFPNALFPDN